MGASLLVIMSNRAAVTRHKHTQTHIPCFIRHYEPHSITTGPVHDQPTTAYELASSDGRTSCNSHRLWPSKSSSLAYRHSLHALHMQQNRLFSSSEITILRFATATSIETFLASGAVRLTICTYIDLRNSNYCTVHPASADDTIRFRYVRNIPSSSLRSTEQTHICSSYLLRSLEVKNLCLITPVPKDRPCPSYCTTLSQDHHTLSPQNSYTRPFIFLFPFLPP